jgi:uncharacterized protein (DUF1684 family)
MSPLLLLLFSLQSPFLSDTAAWRENREARLKAPGGWLSLAGLFWLKEGDNEVPLPSRCGPAARIGFHAGRAVFDGRELRPDVPGPAEEIVKGDCTFFLIRRGDRFAIRLKDVNSAARTGFKGLRWYAPDAAYRVRARFVSAPRRIPVLNIVGITEEFESPGYAEFRLEGRDLRLRPVLETEDATELFYIFRDETSGRETYPAGRFVYSDFPRNGEVILDFNRAYNPPCTFTEFATCPLPPRENRLSIAVRAGEKNYGAP